MTGPFDDFLNRLFQEISSAPSRQAGMRIALAARPTIVAGFDDDEDSDIVWIAITDLLAELSADED
jgi:hypothetical protein